MTALSPSPLTPLRFLATCLASGEDQSAAGEAVRHALDQGHVDWRRVIWLASAHLVTPSLSAGLERLGGCDHLPEEVAGYLDAFRQLNSERNAVFREELGRIAAGLNRIGLEPLLLKGANALLPDAYPGAEDRMLGDLDLWVPENRLDEATTAIVDLGYRIAHESWQWVLPADQRRHHHGMPLLHRQLPVKVELHHRLLHEPVDAALLAQHLRSDRVVLECGLMVQRPDPLTRLRHNVLHAQITDRQQLKRQLSLRQLLEFASIVQHHSDGIDARQLLEGLRPQRHRTLFEYWAQAEHWLGLPYPTELPRSPNQSRELCLVERTATRKAWAKGFQVYGGLLRLPRRLLSLGQRVFLMPGYFPAKIKSLIHPKF